MGFSDDDDRIPYYADLLHNIWQKYGQKYSIDLSGHSNGAMNLLNVLMAGLVLPKETFANVAMFNAPRLRDLKGDRRYWRTDYGATADKYLTTAPSNVFFLQSQFDFGLGSVFGEYPDNIVPSYFDPYLHF